MSRDEALCVIEAMKAAGQLDIQPTAWADPFGNRNYTICAKDPRTQAFYSVCAVTDWDERCAAAGVSDD
jgi:hypothetical protein